MSLMIHDSVNLLFWICRNRHRKEMNPRVKQVTPNPDSLYLGGKSIGSPLSRELEGKTFS